MKALNKCGMQMTQQPVETWDCLAEIGPKYGYISTKCLEDVADSEGG